MAFFGAKPKNGGNADGSQFRSHLIKMSSTVKRKSNPVLSPDTKRARFDIVHKLAVRVHGIQLENADRETGTDGSSAGTKYGVFKKLIKEAEKIYTWIDRHKVYNAVKLIKNHHSKALAAS